MNNNNNPEINLNINGNNYSFEYDKKNLNLSLNGFGWRWTGREDQLIGFLVRITNSDIKQEFVDNANKRGLNIKEPTIQKMLKKALKENDGLYEMSGDNRLWHFGETNEIEEMLIEEYIDTNNQILDREKFKEYFWDNANLEGLTDYELFEKEHGKDYQRIMNTVIKESENLKELLDRIKRVTEEQGEEMQQEFLTEQINEQLEKVYSEYENRKEE